MIRPLRDLEKEAILSAIMETGNIVKAAGALGICRSTIYEKLEEYGLKPKANQIIAALKAQRTLFRKSDSQ